MTPIRPLLLLAVASALLAQGCATSKHDVAKPEAGQVSVCTKCYDQIRKARSTGGPLGGLATNRTVTTHMCEECKSDMTIYENDGVLKVRCATCAPEGVDCDRCVPKTAAKGTRVSVDQNPFLWRLPMNRSTVLFASTSLLVAGMLTPAALAQCCGAPESAATVATPANSVGGGAGTPAAFAVLAASMANVSAEPVNKVCPIKEGEVDAESPTRTYKGVTIGFCCPGCEGKWDKKSDDEKLALLAKHAPEAVTAIEAAAKSKPQVAAKDTQPDAAALASNPAVKIARAYMAACTKADAAALNAIFLDEGRATVSENASDEGTWETYRDHHLLPELKEMPGFVMTVTKEDVQIYGTTSIVRQIGTFTVPDPNHKQLTKKYLAAVTYVVVDEGGTPKIAHLHWSSRAEKKPDTAAPTTPEAGHGHGAGHEHK